MKYAQVLVILGVVAAQLVLAQHGDQQPPSGGDHGKPGGATPKLALHRLRRQLPMPAGGGNMAGGASMGFGASGQANGQAGGEAAANGGAGAAGEAAGQAGGQAGGQVGGQFGAQGGFSGGAGAGGNAGFTGGFGAQAQGQVKVADK